ncbi:Plasmodium exported protein (Pm-fam-a like), unknown function [Plasmodium malariae]|uniref:Fam-m protein n=1 Tax=Plasmodium malariae TaxID=5858 RepID=A0A1A8X1K2_PLAMA|nr:Plasmodium exported protein (Pm-fam-a like), unknown function [Plasmodium malariae]
MKQKIKLFLFIKIVAFILLTWIYLYNSDVYTFYNYLDQKHKIYGIFDARFYRLLVEYKNENRSNIVCIKRDIPNTRAYEKNGMSKNKKGTIGKNKELKKCSLNIRGGYEQTKGGKSPVYKGGNTYFDKGLLKNKNYVKILREVEKSDSKFIRKCGPANHECFGLKK